MDYPEESHYHGAFQKPLELPEQQHRHDEGRRRAMSEMDTWPRPTSTARGRSVQPRAPWKPSSKGHTCRSKAGIGAVRYCSASGPVVARQLPGRPNKGGRRLPGIAGSWRHTEPAIAPAPAEENSTSWTPSPVERCNKPCPRFRKAVCRCRIALDRKTRANTSGMKNVAREGHRFVRTSTRGPA